jgi:signal transduction histidine kinase
MLEALENRVEQRKKSAIHAFASDTDHKYEIKCIIRDVSRTGCRIVSNGLDDLPEIIHLLPECFDRPILARIVWREKSIAGVKFLFDMEGVGLLIDPINRLSSYGRSSIIEGLGADRHSRKSSFRDRFRFFAQRADKRSQNRRGAERKVRDNPVTDFISTVVHEFRTPLTSLLGSLGLIRNGLGVELPEKAASLFNVAERNAEKLKLMVNDLLDLSKSESGKMQFEFGKVEIVAFARDSIDVNRPYASKYGILLRLDDRLGQAYVRADAARLEQVLTNLLSNAVKYSPQGKAVDVVVDRHDGRVRVSVRDHGPGISSEKQDQVFEKFVQIRDNDGREKQGTGLGLSICKSIIEQQGGNLGVKSELGAGSTFFFKLPEIAAKSSEDQSLASA